MSLADMPVVTVEQIVRFREAALKVEQQHDKLLVGIKRIEAAERFTLDDVRFELRQIIAEIEASK